MIFYGVFYKDKDGFNVLSQAPDGCMHVYPTEVAAKSAWAASIKRIEDVLNPRVEYVRVGGFWNRQYEAVRPEPLEPWVKAELVQKKNTLYVKRIQI